MGSDEHPITAAHQTRVETALDALEQVTMTWSMDAKFTAAVGEGAFIPNSSALHNPFMCTKILDPKEWQFIDFDDISVSEIATGAKPVSSSITLKPLIDDKLKKELSTVSDYRGSMGAADIKTVILSKHPNMKTFNTNVGIILENMFRRNASMQPDGTPMKLINYLRNKELLYKNDTLQQIAMMQKGKSLDAMRQMMGTGTQCIGFPYL